MHPDLERLIALQRIDSAIHAAERQLADEPARLLALDGRIEDAKGRVAVARERQTASQATRRDLEKELSVHQGRISKFRDQIMAVKTNIEYQAMQKEIEFAGHEIKKLEDRMLELMLEADDLQAAVKGAELDLAKEQKVVDGERAALAAELAGFKSAVASLSVERATAIDGMSGQALAIFEMVARKRNGIALAEAKAGVCTICHVRLRPQVFNDVRRNSQLLQCDHCNRILYFVPPPPAPEAATDAVSPPAP